ncbi:ABC transporter substrate-binding protein [Haloplanus rubicundus]|uniref:ABC transporter substrate-binding protein n=1 Tax=Haloplanus rubicundus TaxID=1547898 RepID=A0A345EBL6_9EURY|nr:ABC transporter substrate-binding protein [Haloplanus rubicundus]AXG06209.1 ABC transporter substrate-binding protein [Haloplanus rubicundus]AXG09588.1 ABC transporter substrate-binding protein [Haloplanus rubicundus]
MTTNNSNDGVSRRTFLQGTGSVAAAAAVAGCGGRADSDPTAGTDGEGAGRGEPVPDATLNLINSTITTLDPVAATDTASGAIIENVFDGLMNYPNGVAAVESLLATDYETSDDFTTYTFSLADAQFHNGDAVTAQDFVYSLYRLAFSDNSRRTRFILDSLGVTRPAEGELGVRAVDDETLEIQLQEPFHAVLEMLAYSSFAAVPEGIVGDVEGYEGEMAYETFAQSDPIGAGPYEFEDWTQGTSADITRFDDYHGGDVSNGGVHWDVIEDDQAAYNHAMNRNADVFGLPTAQYDPAKVSVERTDDRGREHGTYGDLRNGLTANYLAVPEISVFYVGFNTAVVPKPVRQAFAYATDQHLLVDEVFKGRGEPAYHFTPPSIYPGGAEAYADHARNAYPYGYDESRLDMATQIMEDAGYGPDNQFRIEWTQYESDTWRRMAQILRDQLASAHIEMEIQQAPFSTLTERGRNGNLEAFTLGWIADWPAPDNFLQLLNPPQTDTSMDAPISFINWSADTGDAAGRATDAYGTIEDNPEPTDAAQQARERAYVEIEEANWEDVGMLNIYHSLGERFWYDWVDIDPDGGMGGSRQKLDDVRIFAHE